MTEEKRKPKFWIDFVGFADFGVTVEANLSLGPEYDLTGVVNTQISSDSARVITLVFNRRKKPLGRRGYSLKQEWEQLPNNQSSLTQKSTKGAKE